MDSYQTNVDNATLFNVYLKPWRAFFKRGGGRGVMASHQALNGVPNHANHWLLTDVLRGGVVGGVNAFVGSDDSDVMHLGFAFGLTTDAPWSLDCLAAGSLAIAAGLDQDLGPVCLQNMTRAVASGMVEERHVDRAAGAVLRAKFDAGLFDGAGFADLDADAKVNTPAARALAYRVASEGAVLLKNDGGLLPLDLAARGVKRVLVVGPNAGCAGNASDCAYGVDPRSGAPLSPVAAQRGSYVFSNARVETLLAAINGTVGLAVAYAQGADWMTTNGSVALIAEAVAAAAGADVIIAVVGDALAGYKGGTVSEGMDSDDLDLPGGQLALLDALAAPGMPPLVTVLIHGRPVTFGAGARAPTGANNGLLDRLPALLAAWHPGQAGGSAIWDIITGAVNPSGRLAQNWVGHVGALRSPANPWFQPRSASYNLGFWSEPGRGAPPVLFCFGSGLSYANFSISSALTITPAGGGGGGGGAPPLLVAGSTYTASLTIDSAGPAGRATVQIYASQDAPTKAVRYTKWLACFAKLDVPANAVRLPVALSCRVDELEAYDPDVGDYVTYTGNYTLEVALSSCAQPGDGSATTTAVRLAGSYDWVPPYLRNYTPFGRTAAAAPGATSGIEKGAGFK